MAAVGAGGHLEEQEGVQLPWTQILLRDLEMLPFSLLHPNTLSLFFSTPHPTAGPLDCTTPTPGLSAPVAFARPTQQLWPPVERKMPWTHWLLKPSSPVSSFLFQRDC